MLENIDAGNLSQSNDQENSAAEYLSRATAAVSAGDAQLGAHLYLAAFEKASRGSTELAEDVIDGLKQAWALACNQKERTLAEYIFEKMEPFLTADELARCTSELQGLALDKLEEYGLSRKDLEEMTDALAQDFLGGNARVVKVEHLGHFPATVRVSGASDGAGELGGSGASDGTDALVVSDGADGAEKRASQKQGSEGNPLAQLAKMVEASGVKLGSSQEQERFSYKDLAGYGRVVNVMRDFGVGMQDDPEFQELVKMLNARHGVDRMPAMDTLLFRSPAREDAHRFMEATAGELGVPAIRMHMEGGLQGAPMLCVMAQPDAASVLNSARNEFTGRAVLLLEDVDLWGAPMTDTGDDLGNFIFAQLSRGAREALNLIRSAVLSPDVHVLASAAEESQIEPFFLELLEPMSVVDIDYPTPEERVEIWMDIARAHPSMRGVNRSDLVRYSAGMPRFDMYMAAREALEEAYRDSLMARRYIPVTRDNLFDKLAAYQPLDSREYHELEDAVIRDFRAGLDHLEDFLSGE